MDTIFLQCAAIFFESLVLPATLVTHFRGVCIYDMIVMTCVTFLFDLECVKEWISPK